MSLSPAAKRNITRGEHNFIGSRLITNHPNFKATLKQRLITGNADTDFSGYLVFLYSVHFVHLASQSVSGVSYTYHSTTVINLTVTVKTPCDKKLCMLESG